MLSDYESVLNIRRCAFLRPRPLVLGCCPGGYPSPGRGYHRPRGRLSEGVQGLFVPGVCSEVSRWRFFRRFTREKAFVRGDHPLVAFVPVGVLLGDSLSVMGLADA